MEWQNREATNIYYAHHKTVLGIEEIEYKVKLSVYNTATVPTLIYGSESCEKHLSQLNAVELKYLRKTSRIIKWDEVGNEKFRKTTK